MSIEGIVIDKVSACHVRENYAAIIGEVAPKKLDDVVSKLDDHLSKLGVERIQCDVCGAWSPEQLPDGTPIDSCPFCNDGREDSPAAAPPPTPVPSTPVVEVLPAPAKKGLKKTKADPQPKSEAPLLAKVERGSEKELDESLARFRSEAETGSRSLYRMGVELRKMRDYLWQQRTEGGKPKYKSYTQFVQTEMEISSGTEMRARRIAENFTEEQFAKFGARFLMVLIAAPKEEHASLLGRVESGEITTAKDLEKEVREIRERKGVEVIETDAIKDAAVKGRNVPSAAATAAAAAKKRTKESAAITVGLKSETFTVKLFAKPAKKEDEKRRARSVEEQPYGILEAINGVRLCLAVKISPAGELEIHGTARRDEDDE